MQFHPTLLALSLLGLAACSTTHAPDLRPRMVAEWEPAIGTLVVHPFELPDELVADLADEGELFVLFVEEERADAVAELERIGVARESVTLVPADARSPWTRDWGPHQIETVDGSLALVDHVFLGYPWVPMDSEPSDFTYRWAMAGEDDAVEAIAAELGFATIDLPAVATGGNLLHDGHGRAFCTEAQLTENLAQPARMSRRPPPDDASESETSDDAASEPTPEPAIAAPIDEATYRALLRERLGIDELVVLENTEPFGIQHIDCWFKVVDPETLLVKRAPEEHPEHDPIERNVAVLAGLTTPSGGRYRIVRIDCPPFEGDRLPAYTNSLRLNGVVHVPLFGGAADDAALATYRSVYPDCTVRGYRFDGWKHFDALHCRTRALHTVPAPASSR